MAIYLEKDVIPSNGEASDIRIEGDMIVSLGKARKLCQKATELLQGRRQKRDYVDDHNNEDGEGHLWSDGVVPFALEEKGNMADAEAQKILRTSILDIEHKTCIEFKEYNPEFIEEDFHYLLITDDDTGCTSEIGSLEYEEHETPQLLALSSGCNDVNTMQHEIFHTLGVYHEHNRLDRDDHVKIHWRRIEEEHESAFYRCKFYDSCVASNLTYNFESIMHYNAYAFSKNKKVTISPYDKRYEHSLGGNGPATFMDIKQLNQMYCDLDAALEYCDIDETYCKNGGYINPSAKTKCICNCPEPFGGADCSERYDKDNCGGHFVASEDWHEFSDDEDNGGLPEGARCVYWITSPPGSTIEIDVDLHLEYSCYYADLEIRDDMSKPGIRYCRDHKSIEFTSKDNDLALVLTDQKDDEEPVSGRKLRVHFRYHPADYVFER